MRAGALLIAAMLTSAGIAAPRAAHAGPSGGVMVESNGTCLDSYATAQRLSDLVSTMRTEDGGRMRVLVHVRAAPSGALVLLTVLDANNELILERQYEIIEADCANAPDLLAVVLTRFLRAWPLVPAQPHLPPQRSLWDLRLQTGAWVSGPKGSGDLELGAWGHYRQLLATGLTLRVLAPARLGGGYLAGFETTAAVMMTLVNASVRLDAGAGFGLRVLRGFSYDVENTVALPWGELRMAAWRKLGGSFALGLAMAASPLRQRAQTRVGKERELPFVRGGVVLEYAWMEL